MVDSGSAGALQRKHFERGHLFKQGATLSKGGPGTYDHFFPLGIIRQNLQWAARQVKVAVLQATKADSVST